MNDREFLFVYVSVESTKKQHKFESKIFFIYDYRYHIIAYTKAYCIIKCIS